MAERRFQPGFRISTIDYAVIIVGVIGSWALWQFEGWIGFVIAFVVAHFFLFCNIFRFSRPLELAWSAIFIVVTYSTIVFEKPSWPITIGISLVATVSVIILEMRKPSYHGILWQRINPGLPQWWVAHGGVLA
jgi:hypothetical protein